MSERNSILASINSHINDYPEIAERWRAGDPTVRAMLTSIVEAVVFLKRDNDVNAIEPFIKSKTARLLLMPLIKAYYQSPHLASTKSRLKIARRLRLPYRKGDLSKMARVGSGDC